MRQLTAVMRAGQFAIFLSVVLSIWAALNSYVFWRLSSLPTLRAHLPSWVSWVGAGLGFLSYPLARFSHTWHVPSLASLLEFMAALWIGVLFLLFVCLLVADILTLGGFLFRPHAPQIRSYAAATALVFSAIALVQGLRPPLVRSYSVAVPGLPPERNGLRLVQISDLHLGSMLGRGWLERLIRQVNQLKPDLLIASGDIVDGNVERVVPLLPSLQKLRAPLGVWAVTGNHEYYAGLEQSVRLFEEAGFKVLRDSWAEAAPGIVIAGVDDLTARNDPDHGRQAVEKALQQKPPGATIYLSHTPWQAEKAAALGAGLMLSGHTHNGQIWPFNYLVGLRYPFMAGRFDIDGMPLVVCRGTGTWGPRMRLWRRSEIVQLELHSPLPNKR